MYVRKALSLHAVVKIMIVMWGEPSRVITSTKEQEHPSNPRSVEQKDKNTVLER